MTVQGWVEQAVDEVPAAGCGGRHPRKTSAFLECLEWNKVMDEFAHGQRGADAGRAEELPGGASRSSDGMNRSVLIGIFYLLPFTLVAAEPKPPATVAELFADFDPRKDPLDTEVVREWEKDGIVTRTVTFHVGTFKGTPARLAAFYAFPKGAKQAAALLNLHGGGQRAALHEAEFYARRGYASPSISRHSPVYVDTLPGGGVAWRDLARFLL
jgi:hypothetical protein